MMGFTLDDVNNIGENNLEIAVLHFRSELLSILDIYDKNVLRNRYSETIDEHLEVNEWHQKLRDKDVSSLYNIPNNILKYHKKDIEKILGVTINLNKEA